MSMTSKAEDVKMNAASCDVLSRLVSRTEGGYWYQIDSICSDLLFPAVRRHLLQLYMLACILLHIPTYRVCA